MADGMTMKLEVVPMPVRDIDRAKAFYTAKVGFHEDFDVTPHDGVRIVQLTPPGSGCSIILAAGFPDIAMPPGSLRGLHLVVSSINEVRDTLVARGVDVGNVIEMKGIFFSGFADPDGNTWVLQEIPPGRG
jgi:catechol 2,3-dioxygenase-like lactoylglutathione lyase family enzyme